MDKPTITDEARQRITAFVAAVEKLQIEHKVRLCADDNTIAVLDAERTQFLDHDPAENRDFIYGNWSAQLWHTAEAPHSDECGELDRDEPCICGAIMPGVTLAGIEFEDFDGWGK